MQRRKKRIDASLRSKILQESMVSGCNLAGLAREHQIPARTLYAWRKKSCRNKADSDVALGTTIQAKDRFVEVKLPEQIKAGSSIKLKRAVLEFDEFSISIEGKLNNQYLSQLLEILNQPC